MPEKKSAVEVLRVLVERVRRIEADARFTVAILEKLREGQSRRQGEPGAGKGGAS
jgi:hypothetical protein